MRSKFRSLLVLVGGLLALGLAAGVMPAQAAAPEPSSCISCHGFGQAPAAPVPATVPGMSSAQWYNFGTIGFVGMIDTGTITFNYNDRLYPGGHGTYAGFFVGKGGCIALSHMIGGRWVPRGNKGAGQWFATDNGQYALNRC